MAGAFTLRMRGWRPWRTSWLIVGTKYDSLIWWVTASRTGPPPHAHARRNRSHSSNWRVDPTLSTWAVLPLVPLPHRERQRPSGHDRGVYQKRAIPGNRGP